MRLAKMVYIFMTPRYPSWDAKRLSLSAPAAFSLITSKRGGGKPSLWSRHCSCVPKESQILQLNLCPVLVQKSTASKQLSTHDSNITFPQHVNLEVPYYPQTFLINP